MKNLNLVGLCIGLIIAVWLGFHYDFQMKNFIIGCIGGAAMGFILGSMFPFSETTEETCKCECGNIFKRKVPVASSTWDGI